MQETKKFIKDLEKLNCGLSVDHFGVTDSSLRIIDQIKPSYVNIRGSVLDGLIVSQKKQAYVRQLLNHAKDNNVIVIASSIEDPATLTYLFSIGIRYFQGYFIQEPSGVLEYNFQNAVL